MTTVSEHHLSDQLADNFQDLSILGTKPSKFQIELLSLPPHILRKVFDILCKKNKRFLFTLVLVNKQVKFLADQTVKVLDDIKFTNALNVASNFPNLSKVAFKSCFMNTTKLDENHLTHLIRVSFLSIQNPLLEVFGNDQLSLLGNLPNLNHLEIVNCPGLHNLTPSLDHLTRLQKLTFFGTRANIDFLSCLTRLTHLTIVSPNSINLDSLSKCVSLRHLHLINCNLTDVTNLSFLTNLTDLNLKCNNDIGNLMPLTQLTQLKKFNFSHNVLWYDVEKLIMPGIPQDVVSLDFSHCYISNVGNLQRFKKLTHLTIDCNETIENIGGLSALNQLTHLSFSGPSIGSQGLSVISNLKALVWLCLAGCNSLTDLDFLHNLNVLKHLDLSFAVSVEQEALMELASHRKNIQIYNLSDCMAIRANPVILRQFLANFGECNPEIECVTIRNGSTLMDDEVFSFELIDLAKIPIMKPFM